MLGDTVERALTAIGITPSRVEYLLGAGCRCGERKARLNDLHAWAQRVVIGKTELAREYLKRLLGEQDL